MKKALIVITKRVIIDTNASNPHLKNIYENAIPEIREVMSNRGIKNYDVGDKRIPIGLKQIIDGAAQDIATKDLFNLNGVIPDFWDTSHRVNLRSIAFQKQIPAVEVLLYSETEPEELRLAVSFETEPLILLDSIDNKLLLSIPNTTGEDDAEQTIFTNTFFVKLTDEIYFSEYKIL